MIILSQKLTKNRFNYTLVRRTKFDPNIRKNVAIYQQLDRETNEHVAYEVFIVKNRFKDTPTPSGIVLPPSEVFPSNESFGSTSFVALTRKRAMVLYEQLIKRTQI